MAPCDSLLNQMSLLPFLHFCLLKVLWQSVQPFLLSSCVCPGVCVVASLLNQILTADLCGLGAGGVSALPVHVIV